MVEGFSRMSQEEKISFLTSLMPDYPGTEELLRKYWHPDPLEHRRFSELSENTVSSFYLPFSVAPNFLINGRLMIVPMVTEESSVVAAAASAAKFWASRGGFKAKVINHTKYGQIHFTWEGDPSVLQKSLEQISIQLKRSVAHLTERMEKRGGGIQDMQLHQLPISNSHVYQLLIGFSTADSMGANFINSCLETMAAELEKFLLDQYPEISSEIIMAILSNYNPECLVEVELQCPAGKLDTPASEMSDVQFARKFKLAMDIASEDVFRATTHNKGIFNGIDAVAVATGNDFRALEAGGHAWAARDGKYRSLSKADLSDGVFSLKMTVPLTLGTVGGLTSIHPLAGFSIRLLGSPSSGELMQIVASAGLASNFAAVKALITQGIQKGHMKMHLSNVLNSLSASDSEKQAAKIFFRSRTVSFAAVVDFLKEQRKQANS